MVDIEMLEERNTELYADLVKAEEACHEAEKVCQMVRGAIWENENILTALMEEEEEDGNGISHNEVVPQPEGYCSEVPEPYVEAPYDDDDNGISHNEEVEDAHS